MNNFAEHSNFSLKKRIIRYLYEKDDELEEKNAKLPLSKILCVFCLRYNKYDLLSQGQCAPSQFDNP